MTNDNDVDFVKELQLMLVELHSAALAYAADPTEGTSEELAMTAVAYGALTLASMKKGKGK